MPTIPDYPTPENLDGTEIFAAWLNGRQAAVKSLALAKFIIGSLGQPVPSSGFLDGPLNADGNRILNLPAPSDPHDPVRLVDIQQAVSSAKSAPLSAIEQIAAGDFVNIYPVGGVARVRRATAADPTGFAVGFALTAIPINTVGQINFDGFNSAASVSSTVAEVWLSDTTPGSYLLSPPTAAGSIIQPLGIAVADVGILFSPRERVGPL